MQTLIRKTHVQRGIKGGGEGVRESREERKTRATQTNPVN
jgi:hypothetical protein